mgnify:CR=1 FL=1
MYKRQIKHCAEVTEPDVDCLRDGVVRSYAIRVAQVELVTVSYTHLRAHETVLDLVCRLLLEKKKTSNTKSCVKSKLTQNPTKY